MKCKVCGKRFSPDSKRLYQVTEAFSVSSLVTKPLNVVYDAMDCPRCGCQMVLNERKPKVAEGGVEDDD